MRRRTAGVIRDRRRCGNRRVITTIMDDCGQSPRGRTFVAMGGSHFGGHVGWGFGGDRGGRLAGRFEQGHHGRRGLAVPFGYYDDWDSGYYDSSTVTPDEQPSNRTTAYAHVKPPRSSCSTQTYKVPSEAGGEASINIVRC
jgi:hypothetical protein